MAILKDARQLRCVFQDVEPPKSSSILRKRTKILRPTRRAHCSKATLRHANIRESEGPSLGIICPTDPCERCPYAPKFEDGSQEETERQGRCARGDTWRLANSILKLNEKDKATFFLTYRGLVIPSTIRKKKKRRKKIVVDSWASMHMLSRRDLSRIGFRKSVSTSVYGSDRQWWCANQWRSNSVCQRIGFIRDSKASRRYTSSPLTWKTLRRSRIFIWVEQWSVSLPHQGWQTSTMQHGKQRTDLGPRFVDRFFQLNFTYISSIVIAGFYRFYKASGQRASTERPVAWFARMVRKIHRKTLWTRGFPTYKDAPASSSRESSSVEGQPSRKPKKNDDKSAVALPNEEFTTIGLRVSGRRAAEIQFDFTDGYRVFETNSHSEGLKGHDTAHQSSGENRSIAWRDSVRHSSRAQSVRSNICGSVLGGDGRTRVMRPRGCVETGEKYPKAHRKGWSYLLLTNWGLVPSSALPN